MTEALTFGVASAEDHDQIFSLNYETFVEEIPQHPPNEARRLVDRFHDENTYLVARRGGAVVGMVALRARRPFSLDQKIGPVDPYLPPHQRVCEIRLLAVRRERRRGMVFRGLLDLIRRVGVERGYDLAVVSGTTRQRKLYEHLGFIPFGPLVGAGDARFQPMYLTLEAFVHSGAPVLRRRRIGGEPTSFLPGPVAIAPAVREAFARPALSHRSAAFHALRVRVERDLCELTSARCATLFLGSGTLANDVVAGQLAVRGGAGVVVVDGEFGTRLTEHARGAGLTFDAFERPWGAPFSVAELARFLGARPATRWLWTTLCETSTGALHDLDALRAMCRELGVELHLDAISAIGAVPVDLRGVQLATAVSGKALGAFPGVAVVFHRGDAVPQPDRLPRYLDLGCYLERNGVPFTQSSNLVSAFATALERYRGAGPFAEVPALAAWLRPRLRGMGLRIVMDDERSSPAVTTLRLPPEHCARAVGDRLARGGFLVSYESEYLRARNWLQICLMGHCQRDILEQLVDALVAAVDRAPAVAVTERVASAQG